MKMNSQAIRKTLVVFATLILINPSDLLAQHSVAREWNEVTLEAIRGDWAKPTVHARNLYHVSIAMYDAWAAYDSIAEPYLLGRTINGFTCPFTAPSPQADIEAAREEAISFAAYRVLTHRYANSPGNVFGETQALFDQLMSDLGYWPGFTGQNYETGFPAELGNYIGDQIIQYGLQDGANEINDYINTYYTPVNPELEIDSAEGNPTIVDYNRWQPLALGLFIDQGGNLVTTTPEFLSPEWGNVDPFSLQPEDMDTYTRDGDNYNVYLDPGAPPYIDTAIATGLEDNYKWGNAMVVLWQSHHNPVDGNIIDISPASIGNNPEFPTSFDDYSSFYDFFEGGDASLGHDLNPITGMPYAPQFVPRGDYGRVLAEFWADGPDSETPPGHWFTIINYVNDQPDLEKKWKGKGEVLNDLEWDIKTYFVLGGTMHDAAVAAWSVKGYYDYIRPVSAIRAMCDLGQSTDPFATNYHPGGVPIIPGFIETVEIGDPLAGASNENVGKIKLYTWRGPDYINNPETDVAGVGWILSDFWWPYQRPTFVTPPFAGYVSGHSTYSRAAAEVLTLMTGDPFFPGGMGEFLCPQNEFLVFEDGPSIDLTLQWATYRDASDQCSLSRIWGGIHPPADDIPGRLMGEQIGHKAFEFASLIMDTKAPLADLNEISDLTVTDIDDGDQLTLTFVFDELMDTTITPMVSYPNDDPTLNSLTAVSQEWMGCDTFIVVYDIIDANESLNNITIQLNGAKDQAGNDQLTYSFEDFSLDTYNPSVVEVTPVQDVINDDLEGLNGFGISVVFDDVMDTGQTPLIDFPNEDPEANTLSFNSPSSYWMSPTTFIAVFDVTDAEEELDDIDVAITGWLDDNGNAMIDFSGLDQFSIDMKNPEVIDLTSVSETVSDANVGNATFDITVVFDDEMNMTINPDVSFPMEDPLANTLTFNDVVSGWIDPNTYSAVYNVADSEEHLFEIDVYIENAFDAAGNEQNLHLTMNYFDIDTKNPTVLSANLSEGLITDANVGSGSFEITFEFDEEMNISAMPALNFPSSNPLGTTLTFASGMWMDGSTYVASYDVMDADEVMEVDVQLIDGMDSAGNALVEFNEANYFDIEMDNPDILVLSANTYNVDYSNTGDSGFSLLIIFDEEMNMSQTPMIEFPVEDPSSILTFNAGTSEWVNDLTYSAKFDVENGLVEYIEDIDVQVQGGQDLVGNAQVALYEVDFFDISVDWTTTGISEISEQFLNVIPNPVKAGNPFVVEYSNQPNVRVNVYSPDGKEVRGDYIIFQDRISIETNGWNSGIYLVHLVGEDYQSIARVVIQ